LSISYDIVKFNTHVKNLMDSLYARGETTQDLLATLFKDYKAVKDRDFITYIKKKEDAYEEGKSVEIEMLVLQASNKYKTMVEAKTWNAPSPEDKKIMDLEAQLKKMKKPKEPNKPIKLGKPSKEKGKGKGKEKPCPGKPAWMTKPPPAADKLKTKTVDGKAHLWCSKHKSWGSHEDAKCQGHGLMPKLENDPELPPQNPRAPSG